MTLISMTWHSDPNRKHKWSETFYRPNYLTSIRHRVIDKQIKDYVNFIYLSGCKNSIDPLLLGTEITVRGQDHEFKKGYDSFVGMAAAVQYAYSNGMDYLYIEHDCLVHGLDKILSWAKGKRICYGYGEYSFFPGWAEQSLVYMDHAFLPEFLIRLNNTNITTEQGVVREIVWQKTFEDVFTPWPFGYGRKRPINFTDEVFYAQQLTDQELKNILEYL